jgi:formylglycine-generating enzyme required for sulfatase activity
LEEQKKIDTLSRRLVDDYGGSGWNVLNEKMHRVLITQGYWLGEHPVTQRQWQILMGRSQSHELRSLYDSNILPQFFLDNWPRENPHVPVVFINWKNAVEYCRRLTVKEISAGNIPEGWSYQLPTEAQWERACRAGTKTETYAGDLDYVHPNIAPSLDKIAWYWGNSFRDFPDGGLLKLNTTSWSGVRHDGVCGPREVGLKQANNWGLSDTLGNVCEWCLDWSSADYEEKSIVDPEGPDNGQIKVLRGGAFVWDKTIALRAAARITPPSMDDHGDLMLFGFRVALVPPKMKQVRSHLLCVLTQRTSCLSNDA